VEDVENNEVVGSRLYKWERWLNAILDGSSMEAEKFIDTKAFHVEMPGVPAMPWRQFVTKIGTISLPRVNGTIQVLDIGNSPTTLFVHYEVKTGGGDEERVSKGATTHSTAVVRFSPSGRITQVVATTTAVPSFMNVASAS